jgi:phosphatidylglycerol:prolipoprotein diacylglycerol transferase
VVSDVGFWVIIAAIIGARLYYVFLHLNEFAANPLSVFNPFQGGNVGIGGLVMYGGFIGAIIAGFLYFRLSKQSFLPYADAIAPSVGLGIFLTRIGCFLNGCCYGAPTEHACGVVFPPDSPAGYYQRHLPGVEGLMHIQPSQLYLSAGGLAIAAIVFLAGRKKLFHGFEFYLVGILYAILRFSVDFTRFYPESERLGGLSHNQVVCIGIFVVFGGLMLKKLVLKDQSDDEPAEPVSDTTQSDQSVSENQEKISPTPSANHGTH